MKTLILLLVQNPPLKSKARRTNSLKINKHCKNKLKKLKPAIADEMDKLVEQDKQKFIQANIEQLEKLGEDSQERKLKTPYSAKYEKYKKARGGQVNYTDLKLTGEFHKSISLEQQEKGLFLFGSDDEKYQSLRARYGEILGVQEDNLEKITKGMEPKLNKFLDNYIK